MQSMAIRLQNLIGLTNFLRRTNKVIVIYCGKPLKENEVIPYQERQIVMNVSIDWRLTIDTQENKP